MAHLREVIRVVPVAGDVAFAAPPQHRLEEVRHLAARFPDAGLREVALIRADDLDRRADPTGATRVWLAHEALQVTGSFKVRGALYALERLGAGRVVAVSAGNHGAGVAYAARALGISARIVVPRGTPQAKRDKIAAYGAELVVVESDQYDDADAEARRMAAAEGVPFVSPYEGEDVALGNGGSLGFEIVRALGGVPDRAIVPFGGGGLACGIAWAFASELSEEHASEARAIVWGAQSEASCAMALSLERGAAVERLAPSGPTLADGLEGGIAASAFERAKRVIAGMLVVSEADIAAAMVHALRAYGMTLEGSAAVALVPLLGGLPEPLRGGDLVAVLTGRNVDAARIDALLDV